MRSSQRVGPPPLLPILVTLLLALVISGSPARGQSYPTIATIRIDREDVFDLDNPDERHLPFIWADRLHVETRDHVIRRELLFQEGDPADPDVLCETARNLRRLGFLHDNPRPDT